MASQQYKDWLKPREGTEHTLNPDGVKSVPTHGHGYAYGWPDEQGRFVPRSAEKVNADLNYAKGTVGKTYVTQQAMESMRGKTQGELRAMFRNGTPEGLDTHLDKTEMDRLQDISIGEAEQSAKTITGSKWDSLTPAQQEALTDLRYRGGDNLYRKNKEGQTTGRSKLYDHIQNGNEVGAAYEILYNSNGDKAAGNDVRQMQRMEAWMAEKTPEEQEKFKRDLDTYVNAIPDRQKKRDGANERLQQQKNTGRIPHTAEDIFRPKPKQESGLPGAIKKTPPTTTGKQSSILDGIGDTLSAVGSAAATIGHMAYDTAMSVGKDTLVHMVTQAANGSGGKAVLAQAAQVAMAQTLSRMHSLVMQEVERQQPSQPWRTPGIAGPIPQRDATTQESIERTINDPRNAGIFNDIATRVERILTQVGDAHPAAVMVSKVMEVLRGGNIKVQPNILVPDLFPQEDGPARQPQGDERAVEIAGISIPVRLPEVRVIMDESGAVGMLGRTPDFNPNASSGLHRGADGAIEVRGYTRGDGTQVAAHTRSAPDGVVSNNFSFRRKG